MIKIVIISLIFTIVNLSYSTSFETPDDSYDIQDDLEVDQKSRDKKIWKNLVQVYLGFRQIAKNSQAILERIVDWAWSAQKYLSAVENLAGTACVVYKNIQETGTFKWYDFVGIIEHLEEDVFQYTDYILTDGIDELKNSRERLNLSRRLLFTDPFQAKENMHKEIENNKSYQVYYTEILGCSMHQGVANKYSYRSEVKRNLLTTNIAAEAVAGGNIRNMSAGNRAAIVENLLQNNTNKNGEISMVAQAEANVVNNRNKLFTEVSFHEQLQDAVRINAMMLLQKTTELDYMLLNRAGVVVKNEEINYVLRKTTMQR